MENAKYLGEKVATLWITENMKPVDVRAEISLEMTKLHCKLFKIRYSKKIMTPACVTEDLQRSLPDNDNSSSSDDDGSESEVSFCD